MPPDSAMTPRKPRLNHLGYRPDIDGLRAVAILLVLGFHAFPEWFPGGFIGVDIFFVISGFLISTIILNGLNDHSFSFYTFYERRINRIFPALLLVLFFCFLLGWFALLAEEFSQLGKHIAGATTFVINFLFQREADAYFGTSSELRPLLHLWSLSIEEQFYILWPIFLWRLSKRGVNLFLAACIVAVISFLLNIYILRNNAAGAFFWPQTRIWELLLGSLLASALRSTWSCNACTKISITNTLRAAKADSLPGNFNRNLLAFFGTGLIVLGTALISKESQFPGWWALLPTAGTLFIITAGSTTWINRIFLSNRFFVGIGLISFPLYLWHWPLLSYARIILGEELSFTVRWWVLALSFLLAWLTYRFVELPIYNKDQADRNRGALKLVFLLVTIGGLGIYSWASNGLVSRYADSDMPAARSTLGNERVTECTHSHKANAPALCRQTDPRAIIAVIGDSHSGHLVHGFAMSPNSRFNKTIFMYQSGCMPTLGVESSVGCGRQLTDAISFLKSADHIEYIVISAYSGWYERASIELRDMYYEGYQKTILELLRANKKIVFMIDTPAFKESVQKCLGRPLKLRMEFRVYPTFCDTALETEQQPRASYIEMIERLKNGFPEVFFFDAHSAICPSAVCNVSINSRLLFGDANHLSEYGSALVVQHLIGQLMQLDVKGFDKPVGNP